MADLFSAALRSRISRIQKDIFDSFKRTEKIRFYKQAKEIYVPDPNYISDFDDYASRNNLKIEDFQEFDVCLIYMDRQESLKFIPGEDSNIRMNANYNRIRIQVEADAYAYMEGTERYIFGEDKFVPEDSWRKIGLLEEFKIYETVLQRVV